MKLKQVNCICNSGSYKIILKKNGFNIVKCNECGHIYVNPRLEFDVLLKMYNNNKISPSKAYIQTEKEDIQTFNYRLEFIKKYLHTNCINALDIGCATGSLMEVAEKKGWKILGIDLNESSVRECNRRGLNAKCTSFEDFNSNAKFEVIIMDDFIEHTEKPEEALSKANSYLNKGGILFITTPDIGSLIAKLTKSKWLHLKPDEHLHYFTRKSIVGILNKTGFKVLEIISAKRKRNFGIMVNKLKTYSSLLSWILNKTIPELILKRTYFNINVGDEMAVISRKK